MAAPQGTQLTIPTPDDMHLHVRDGAIMEAVIKDTARQFARAIIMPNLLPPVTSVEQAEAYKQRIEAAARQGFTPLMTLYLTDTTDAATIKAARASGFIHGVKLYPAGATTNSDSGVTALEKVSSALEAMEEEGLPLLIHGEVTDAHIDIFDREARFIDEKLSWITRHFPKLRIVFEHITTIDAAQYVQDAPEHIVATITAHHLLYSRNALLAGGIRPHYYCLPILKREEHRETLVKAALSGSPKFFAGTDSAPHIQSRKESECGCAGCYTASHALEFYAEAFDDAAGLHKTDIQAIFRGFMSQHGAAFYGLPQNAGTITLEKTDSPVPAQINTPEGPIIPLRGGEMLSWRLV